MILVRIQKKAPSSYSTKVDISLIDNIIHLQSSLRRRRQIHRELRNGHLQQEDERLGVQDDLGELVRHLARQAEKARRSTTIHSSIAVALWYCTVNRSRLHREVEVRNLYISNVVNE